MTSLGVAVVGTGFIGPVHVEAVRRLGHHVVGILGSSPEKSRQAATALFLPKAYADFQQLLADPAVRVVHLASPNVAHFEQCQLALAAGKHVICEKPLAMTTTETQQLVRLAAASPLVTAVNYNVRFYPHILEARTRVLSGQLGRLLHVTGSYLQDWLLYPTDFNWRVLAEQGGALRAIADIGTHWLDTIRFITGLEIQAVCADLSTIHPVRYPPSGSHETFSSAGLRSTDSGPGLAITTEDYGSILLRFANGVKGCLSVSQVTAGRKNCIRWDIAGSEAALAWDSEEPNSLLVGHRNRANECLTRDPSLLAESVRPYANYPGGHAEGFPDSFKQLYRAIYADILAVEAGGTKSSAPLYATFADGHREVQLCEAILTSHREQRWVDVD